MLGKTITLIGIVATLALGLGASAASALAHHSASNHAHYGTVRIPHPRCSKC